MVDGYGNEILTKWKQLANWDSTAARFPLIPGRDCSGVVEAVGGSVTHLRPGDKVSNLEEIPVDSSR